MCRVHRAHSAPYDNIDFGYIGLWIKKTASHRYQWPAAVMRVPALFLLRLLPYRPFFFVGFSFPEFPGDVSVAVSVAVSATDSAAVEALLVPGNVQASVSEM